MVVRPRWWLARSTSCQVNCTFPPISASLKRLSSSVCRCFRAIFHGRKRDAFRRGAGQWPCAGATRGDWKMSLRHRDSGTHPAGQSPLPTVAAIAAFQLALKRACGLPMRAERNRFEATFAGIRLMT